MGPTKSSIKVADGTGDSKNHRSWDTSEFGKVNNRSSDAEAYWSTPPQSLMHSLAEISKDLLGIDPKTSNRGILIRVDRELPFGSDIEWLPWHAPKTFNEFLQEIFYKIDGNAIKIYPGDYVGRYLVLSTPSIYS